MNKNLIKFNEPFLSKNTKKNLFKVLKNRNFTDGEFQKRSEKLIQKLTKSKSIKLTQSCTNALEIAMILANIKEGDEVIVPSYTFTSTANCVLLRNAKPVFADIKTDDLNLDFKSVEKKITNKTKAIIVVHYGGVACNMQKFLHLKKKYNLYLIEDAAHSFLGKYKNKFLGTIGDLGAFSFHETKNIVGGQCGALSINNKKFIKQANIILDKGTDRYFMGKKNYYSWHYIGSEYRAPELSAALVYSQLENINKIQSRREKIWNSYYNSIKIIKNQLFYLPIQNNKSFKNAFHVFPLIFKNSKIKNKFIKFMKKNNIQCFFHYYPLHMSKFGKKISKIKLRNTEKIYNGLVRLPLYPNLTKFNQKRVINKITTFVKNYNFL